MVDMVCVELWYINYSVYALLMVFILASLTASGHGSSTEQILKLLDSRVTTLAGIGLRLNPDKVVALTTEAQRPIFMYPNIMSSSNHLAGELGQSKGRLGHRNVEMFNET